MSAVLLAAVALLTAAVLGLCSRVYRLERRREVVHPIGPGDSVIITCPTGLCDDFDRLADSLIDLGLEARSLLLSGEYQVVVASRAPEPKGPPT